MAQLRLPQSSGPMPEVRYLRAPNPIHFPEEEARAAVEAAGRQTAEARVRELEAELRGPLLP
jgi:hypothetical protein